MAILLSIMIMFIVEKIVIGMGIVTIIERSIRVGMNRISIGIGMRDVTELVNMNGPFQDITKGHNFRSAAPVTIFPHQVAIFLASHFVLCSSSADQIFGSEVLVSLEKEESAWIGG